jgi:hypothetical protein
MGIAYGHPGRRSGFGRVLESNESRLEALDRQGVQVVVDARQMLQFFLDRALVSSTPREFEHEWVLNVAGLVKEFEAEARSTENPGRRLP